MLTGVGIIIIPASLTGIWMNLRTKSKDYNGFWQVPGGTVDIGETPREAAVRELEEETGIIVQPDQLVQVYTGEFTKPNGERYASTQFALISRLVPRHREKTKATLWQLVPWAEIGEKKMFDAMRCIFPAPQESPATPVKKSKEAPAITASGRPLTKALKATPIDVIARLRTVTEDKSALEVLSEIVSDLRKLEKEGYADILVGDFTNPEAAFLLTCMKHKPLKKTVKVEQVAAGKKPAKKDRTTAWAEGLRKGKK